ncbi:MAG: hypothetical protein AAF563_03255 [Pseudomonadota bacterium]
MRAQADILCFSDDRVHTWGSFSADVELFRQDIASATHVCNMLAGRYDFMVGFAAAMLNDQVTVLPSAAASQAVAAAQAGAERPLLLGDAPPDLDNCERIAAVPRSGCVGDPIALASALDGSVTEVHVFTSGSTKDPVRHFKDWAALAGGAGLTEKILRDLGCDPGSCAILGTTPHQHMYGLEATILTGLAYGHSIYDRTIFYPADLERAAEIARKVGFKRLVLITSPSHLRFLEPTILATPEICGVVSATAPLSPAQAGRLEARGDLPVMEIYGTTETGSLAERRTVRSDEWRPLDGFVLEDQPQGCMASAPYLRAPVRLGDAIEQTSQGQFRLLGRPDDMVNVAGKRTNLAALNAILSETREIQDGVVLRYPSDDGDIIAVIAVLDRASNTSEAEAKSAIRRQFRKYVDPIFSPKRIGFTDQLPRSKTGKIPERDMRSLMRIVGIVGRDGA